MTDVTNPTVNIDCHYAAFNVELTEEELSQWKETEGGSYTGFGFMIMTYDNLNGGLKEYDEVGLLHEYESWEDIPADVKKYIDWVEFRPTSDANVLAEYKPRNYADGKTFNLYDASKGITGAQKSSTNWYTCFVNEYTYEAANANETMAATGSQQPLWYSYVNADPRRFYIRVTRTISEDGESVYARSKYAVVQNSIQTYYGRRLCLMVRVALKVRPWVLKQLMRSMALISAARGLKALRQIMVATTVGDGPAENNGRLVLTRLSNNQFRQDEPVRVLSQLLTMCLKRQTIPVIFRA